MDVQLNPAQQTNTADQEFPAPVDQFEAIDCTTLSVSLDRERIEHLNGTRVLRNKNESVILTHQ